MPTLNKKVIIIIIMIIIITIEAVQRRATKLVRGIIQLSYNERLQALKLPTLQYRRNRGDMITTYKIFHGLVDTDPSSKFFKINQNKTKGLFI